MEKYHIEDWKLETTGFALAITASMAVSAGSAFAQNFRVEGTDAVMGVGARYLSMGGPALQPPTTRMQCSTTLPCSLGSTACQ